MQAVSVYFVPCLTQLSASVCMECGIITPTQIMYFHLQITRALLEEYPKLRQLCGSWFLQKVTGEIMTPHTGGNLQKIYTCSVLHIL